MKIKKRIPLDSKKFAGLVTTLVTETKLLKSGTRLVPWKHNERAILRAINSGAEYLPLNYQQKYVRPLIDHLHSVWIRSTVKTLSGETEEMIKERSVRDLEILAGAVYCHAPTMPEDVTRALHCFLAVISNTFRSFIKPSPRSWDWMPRPRQHQYPPLATFLNIDRPEQNAPYMLTSDAVERATGGSVGVVVLPAIYKDHPLLWTAIAHEVGGHEMLNAVPQLLCELQKGVRKLFFNDRPVQSDDDLDTREKLVGCLWQYWTEEAVSDVCGVLHLGPSYGVSLAVYQAALCSAFAKEWGKQADSPMRLWSTIPEGLARGDLTGVRLKDLDPHPVDILKLHIVIGVIENLTSLSRDCQEHYVSHLKKVAHVCAQGQSEIKICGSLQIGPDHWVSINTYKQGHLKLKNMQTAARRVGAYIATAELNALDGRSLQNLVTWNDADEDAANGIAHYLINSRPENNRIEQPADISQNTNDAQLLAGSTLAFVADPAGYKYQRDALMEALETSYARDYYWGITMLRPSWSYPAKEDVNMTADRKQELKSSSDEANFDVTIDEASEPTRIRKHTTGAVRSAKKVSKQPNGLVTSKNAAQIAFRRWKA